jgi:phage terminase small subunit
LQLRDHQVRRLLRKLREVCPWIQESDGIVARRFCELEVIVSQVYTAILEEGAFMADGEVRGLVDTHRRLTQTQSMLATQLGLTPASRIAMQANSRNVDVDIEAALGRIEKVKAVTTDPGKPRHA